MTFSCPHCGQHMAVETIYQGAAAQCPSCGKDIAVPEKLEGGSGEIARTLQESIDRAELTITQYMQEQDIEGGIDLGDSEDGSTASKFLTAEQGRKYELGDVVASGGMGAIIDAREHNLRRSVAMKVVLNAENATKEHILRFIEEAQVTAQLAHPSIVPVYELGVDVSGNVFYTMKMIKGVTLKDILKKIAEGDDETVKEYPLSRLLTIFQRVCDAIAFAHHRHVIHRDLKPENIMIGEYGEVQVMDWGLAKVIKDGEDGEEKTSSRETKQLVIDSVRKSQELDGLKTMDGAIMGTPGYMAPEQAEGALEEIDERSDIYALGAILYSILTLNKPISSTTLDDFLEKVSSGDIPHPTVFNSTNKRSRPDTDLQAALSHCPAQRVPDSLSAVAMKALSTRREDRYQSVKELQADIDAYQNGFATSAEGASALKQVQLFFKRHKVVASLAAGVFVAILAGGIVAGTQWMRAEQRFRELRDTAPDLVVVSKRLVEKRQLADAVKKAQYAVSLAPDNPEYRSHLADLLQISLQFGRALKEYEQVAQIDAANPYVTANIALCKKLIETHGRKPKDLSVVVRDVYPELIGQRRYRHAIAMFALALPQAENAKGLQEFYETLLRDKGVAFKKLQVKPNSEIMLDLSRTSAADLGKLKGVPLASLSLADCPLSDLSPLAGMPLKSLNLAGCRQVTDLSPLKGMPLKELDLAGCLKVSDLSPLTGMKLTKLRLSGYPRPPCPVDDISPLSGMPLKELSLAKCKLISDFSVLRGMPLEHLSISHLNISDLSLLQGMPLKALDIGGGPVTDLGPLEGMPLVSLRVLQTQVADLSPLRHMPLEEINLHQCQQVVDLSPLAGITNLTKVDWPSPGLTPLTPVETALATSNLQATARAAATVIKEWSDVPAARESVQRATLIHKLASVLATGSFPAEAKAFNGHHYMLWPATMRWPAAKAFAECVGGHLATMTTREEQAFVFTLVDKSYPWVGAHTVDKKPVWVTGEPWTEMDWFAAGVMGGRQQKYPLYGMIPPGDYAPCKKGQFGLIGPYDRCFIIEWDR